MGCKSASGVDLLAVVDTLSNDIDLLHKFVHGGDSETVLLGDPPSAEETATLRNLALQVLWAIEYFRDQMAEVSDQFRYDSYAFNVRRSRQLTDPVAKGAIVTLPVWYYPGRDILLVSVGGMILTPARPDDWDTVDDRQYLEVGDSPNVASNQIRVNFPLEVGDIIDAWVVASNLMKEMAALMAASQAAIDSAAQAAQSAAEAQDSAELAQALLGTGIVESGVGNTRIGWTATAAVAVGGILTLPSFYYPLRGVLVLSYQGSICSQRGVRLDPSALFAYEEIGTDPSVESNQVRVFFPINIGDELDVLILASNVGRNIQYIKDAVQQAQDAARDANLAVGRLGTKNQVDISFGLDAGMTKATVTYVNPYTGGNYQETRLIPVASPSGTVIPNSIYRGSYANASALLTIQNPLLGQVADNTQTNTEWQYTSTANPNYRGLYANSTAIKAISSPVIGNFADSQEDATEWDYKTITSPNYRGRFQNAYELESLLDIAVGQFADVLGTGTEWQIASGQSTWTDSGRAINTTSHTVNAWVDSGRSINITPHSTFSWTNSGRAINSTPHTVTSPGNTGLMPAESYEQIETNTADIAVLKGRSIRYVVHMGSATVTNQATITAAYQDAYQVYTGDTAPIPPADATTLVNVDEYDGLGAEYTWFTTTGTWQHRGQATVLPATNTRAGIVKGVTQTNSSGQAINQGKVFVEDDSSQSVIGFDAVSNAAFGALPANGKAVTAGIADSAKAVAWTGVTGKPATYPATAHAATHNAGGSDPITIPVVAPIKHAASHQSGGADPVNVTVTDAAASATVVPAGTGAIQGFLQNIRNNIKYALSSFVKKTGDIMTGDLTLANGADLRIPFGDYGWFFRNDGNGAYIMKTAAGDPNGTWDGSRPYTYNFETNRTTIQNLTLTRDSQALSGAHLNLQYGSYLSSFNNDGTNLVIDSSAPNCIPTILKQATGKGSAPVCADLLRRPHDFPASVATVAEWKAFLNKIATDYISGPSLTYIGDVQIAAGVLTGAGIGIGSGPSGTMLLIVSGNYATNSGGLYILAIGKTNRMVYDCIGGDLTTNWRDFKANRAYYSDSSWQANGVVRVPSTPGVWEEIVKYREKFKISAVHNVDNSISASIYMLPFDDNTDQQALLNLSLGPSGTGAIAAVTVMGTLTAQRAPYADAHVLRRIDVTNGSVVAAKAVIAAQQLYAMPTLTSTDQICDAVQVTAPGARVATIRATATTDMHSVLMGVHDFSNNPPRGGLTITYTKSTDTYSAQLVGNAATATSLQTPRSIQTNLASTAKPTFNGSADIQPGVTGILPVANGGTGNTSPDTEGARIFHNRNNAVPDVMYGRQLDKGDNAVGYTTIPQLAAALSPYFPGGGLPPPGSNYINIGIPGNGSGTMVMPQDGWLAVGGACATGVLWTIGDRTAGTANQFLEERRVAVNGFNSFLIPVKAGSSIFCSWASGTSSIAFRLYVK